MLRLIFFSVLSATCLRAAEPSACKTWYPNDSYDFSGASVGNAAWGNMSYWVDANGNRGTGAPTQNDDLIFASNTRKRYRFQTQNVRAMIARSIQFGTPERGATIVHDNAGIVKFNNEGLKLGRGNWWFNTIALNYTMTLEGRVTILETDPDYPYVFHYGQAHYTNNFGVISGPLCGSSDAQVLFGWHSMKTPENKVLTSARNSTFALTDISNYEGTITVASDPSKNYKNDGVEFGTRLILSNTTSSATVKIDTDGSIATSSFNDTVTVKKLSFVDGTRIWINSARLAPEGKLGLFKATDSLSVDGKVEVYIDNVVIGGIGKMRIPILAGPSDSTFTVDNFKLTAVNMLLNNDVSLEVGLDESTGLRTLYVTTQGVVVQLSSYNDEDERDGKEKLPSSLTNSAAWLGGYAPANPNNLSDAAFDGGSVKYYTANYFRTFYGNVDCPFYADSLFCDSSQLIMVSQNFSVPELYLNGDCVIGVGQGGRNPSNINAPKIHILSGLATFRSYIGALLSVNGEIDGTGDIRFLGWGNTGSPRAYYALNGMNTNFTGSISISQEQYKEEYVSFDNGYSTFYIYDARNLGGKKPAFDPRALSISRLVQLYVEANKSIVLDSSLNRGLYVNEKGRFYVEAGGIFDIRWPILLSGKMWKEGPGTLVLGGAMKHELEDGGELSDVPRRGSNLFEVVSGKVKIAHADALSGVETSLAAGTALELVLDSANADLMKYGLRNTSVDVPFTLDESFEGKLPISVDASAVPAPVSGVVYTNGIITVKSSVAESVGSMLVIGRIWSGCPSKMLKIEDAELGITTFAIESRHVGTILSIR